MISTCTFCKKTKITHFEKKKRFVLGLHEFPADLLLVLPWWVTYLTGMGGVFLGRVTIGNRASCAVLYLHEKDALHWEINKSTVSF